MEWRGCKAYCLNCGKEWRYPMSKRCKCGCPANTKNAGLEQYKFGDWLLDTAHIREQWEEQRNEALS